MSPPASVRMRTSIADPDEASTFQTLLESHGDALSSPTTSENDSATPMHELPSYSRGHKRSSSRLSHWLDDTTHSSNILNWVAGTPPYRSPSIKPTFPQFASRVQAFLKRWSPRRSTLASCVVVMLVWAVGFATILANTYEGRLSSENGQRPIRLECHTRPWRNTTFCGLDGMNCAPFADTSFTFVCPAQCASVRILEPHTIGDKEFIYTNMVIGGPSTGKEYQNAYRGDSFICQAAIHAGIINNSKGGCGRLTRIGESRDFAGTQANAISSIDFLPAFPFSFTISAVRNSCTDPQWYLLAISVIASVLISVLSANSRLFIGLVATVTFFQVALASDRPFHPELSGLVSMAFERFLPTASVIYTIYRFCIRQTLDNMHARLEKTVLWTGGCWLGALNNYTFGSVPISRLTIHDLTQQPGALTALLIIIVVIIIAATGQISAFRSEGRLLSMLYFYLIVGISIVILALIPTLQLRLHHYIIALILLPGTSMQTRRSMLYQGLLFGLFVNGIARWGYASILQTADALREDGQLGSALPSIASPDITDNSVIRFTVDHLAKGFDGISMLVNDVERYQKSAVSLPVSLECTRTTVDEPIFFRFAFTSLMPLGGISYGDFTKTGIWHSNGTWENSKADAS